MEIYVYGRIDQFSALRLAEQTSSVCSPTAVTAWKADGETLEFAAEFERSSRKWCMYDMQCNADGGTKQFSHR
ncbi:hypothetical protein MB46_19800 (plasmid) [Arthrobacter alpinus]|uniref:hypothetical protein n=1 Tax=Arthrobacter alpinus TaxID=656366 RepID=UPI0005C9AED9|nr:hypothetical protein [Arthrobacter alpinus]ALV47912.1 hypothetical protein MB46_19800 [Arthrobacter alpinus]